MNWVFLNGQFVLEKEAFIPITDRGFLFGDGVFTTIRVWEGQLECWQVHLERLKKSCLQLNLFYPSIELAWVRKLVHLNQAFQGIWRLKIILTGGSSPSLRLPQRKGQLLMTLNPVSDQSTLPCQLCLYPYTIERPLSSLKSLAYLDRLLIAEYAKEKGYQDALVVSSDKKPLETSFSNLIWFDEKGGWIPAQSHSYLSGIFLNTIMKNLSYPIHFFDGTVEEIPSNAFLYLCNTIYPLRAVIGLEERRWKQDDRLERELIKKIDHCLEKYRLKLLP